MALWDAEFTNAIIKAKEGVERCNKWTMHQLTVRAPQTLVVPTRVEKKEGDTREKVSQKEGEDGAKGQSGQQVNEDE